MYISVRKNIGINSTFFYFIFYILYLLSGRRKINVQQKLAGLGLADVLLDMYARMSWDAQPFHGNIYIYIYIQI
jgi:hypothetical protein